MPWPKPSGPSEHRLDLLTTHGLIAGWILQRRARETDWTFTDVVSKKPITFARSNADTLFIDGKAGPAFQAGAGVGDTPAASLHTLSQLPQDIRARSYTVIGRWQAFGSNPYIESGPDSASSNGLCSTRNGDANTDGLYLGVRAGGASVVFACDGAGQLVGSKYDTTINSGQWYTLAGVFEHTGAATYGGIWTLYLDGVPRAQNNYNVAGSFGGTLRDGNIWLGRSGGTNNSDKRIDYLYLLNRALSARDIRQITDDPFRMFYAVPSRRVFFDTGAAAARLSRSLFAKQAVNRSATY